MKCADFQAWTRVRKNYASVVLARMYRGFKSRRELGRLMWKIQARRQKKDTDRCEKQATRLQCWWRSILACQLYDIKLRHDVEIVPDLFERRLCLQRHRGSIVRVEQYIAVGVI